MCSSSMPKILTPTWLAGPFLLAIRLRSAMSNAAMVFSWRNCDGDINHTFLTSLIDPRGMLRVQYLGVRFDLEEFRRDLLSLLDDGRITSRTG